MILSQTSLQARIKIGDLKIEPNTQTIFKAASVKAHLSGLFGKTTDSYVLKPKGFILAKVRETVTLPEDVAAFYDGYVGVATKGLFTHGSSMFIDPGETSNITLEMFNASDCEIELTKDMRVGQYIFMKVD